MGSTIMKKIIRLQIENPKSLDPIYGIDTVSGDIINACYDRLFHFENDHFEPLLLEEYFSNGRSIYCKLKKEVLFSNNKECTSDHVVTSLKRCITKCEKIKTYIHEDIHTTDIQRVDSHVLKINTKMQLKDFVKIFSSNATSIVNLIDYNENFFKRNTCGTGPYVFSSYKNNTLRLIKHLNWWGKEELLDEIVIISNYNYEILKRMFLEGEADIMYALPSDVGSFINKRNIRVEYFPSLDTCCFVLNQASGRLRDYELRRFICNIVNKKEIVDSIHRENIYDLNCVIPAGLGYSYNKCNGSIFDSGKIMCKTINDDKPIKILSVNGLNDAEVMCQNLKEQLYKYGINSHICSLDFNSYCDEFDKGKFDIAFLSWAVDIVDPIGYLYDFYHSKGEVSRAIRYNNKKIDQMIESNKSNNFDSIIQKAESEHLYIWLYQGNNLKIYKNRIIKLKHSLMDGDYSFRHIRVKS